MKKKIISLLLALVMIVGMLPMTVSAETAETTSDSKYRKATPEIINDNPPRMADSNDTSSASGGYSVSEIDSIDADLTLGSDAAIEDAHVSLYNSTDSVRVMVVLDEASLLDSGYSRSQIASGDASADAEAMKQLQEDLVADIQMVVCDVFDIDMTSAVSSFTETSSNDAFLVEATHYYSTLLNGVAVKMPYGALEAVRELEGIAAAFVVPTYSVPEDMTDRSADPAMVATKENFGSASTWGAGYTGKGMKIAIIDTGLDADHPSFAADPEGATLNESGIDKVLTQLNSYETFGSKSAVSLKARNLYRSAKVAYGFNYVDNDLDITHDKDNMGDHGTHVAGITAANETQGTDVVGVAPDAQLLIMKVFGKGGGAYWDDIVAALEDAMILGADAVNMSLGSPAGFDESDESEAEFNEWANDIYAKVEEQDMILAIAAGNSYSAAYGTPMGTNLNLASDPDNGIVSSPATYPSATMVASIENDSVMYNYITVGEGENAKQVPYTDVAYYNFINTLGQGEYTYVMIDGYGTAEDFGDYNFENYGKIAVVSRGSLAFTDKQTNAAAAGFSALIVYDNTDEALSNMQDAESIPNIFVTKKGGAILAAAADENGEGTLIIETGMMKVENPAAGEMSDFSSWGVSPDLELVPDVTAPGGNIYSTVDNGQYGVMSGTSMATPHIAGMSALVLEYLHDQFPGQEDSWYHTVAEALIMSTAEPVVEKTGVLYSPRKQGAGAANVYSAVTSPAYLTVGGSTPKVSLGDDDNKTGKYTFTFEINNLTNGDVTYRIDADALTDQFKTVDGVEYMGETAKALGGKFVFTVNGSEVTSVAVPANGSVTVSVALTLTDDDKAYMDEHYKNGIYVEGFVRCYAQTDDESSTGDLSLPFMGFYGDWSAAPVFDDTGWDLYNDSPKRYWNVLWTDSNYSYNLGANPYIDEERNDEHNVLSPNGDGYQDSIVDIYLGMLRNATKVTFTVKDADGKQVHQTVGDHVRKSYYNSSYDLCIPYIYSNYVEEDLYDFADAQDLEHYTFTIEACLDDGDEEVDDSVVIPITIDTTAPKLDVDSVKLYTEDGDRWISFAVSDNYDIAAVITLTEAGSVIDRFSVDWKEDGEDGESAYMGINLTNGGYDTDFYVAVCDYGFNESIYHFSYEGEGTVNINDDAFYGYRQISVIPVGEYSYVTTAYNGWYSFTDASDMLMHTDAYYTGEANVSAAEYVDGWIIGIDENGNIFASKAGSWDRNVFGTMGDYPGALDMAYDFTTGTMYVITDEYEAGSGAYLLTLDILTGELTKVGMITGFADKVYWGYVQTYGQALTLACDNDGVLYSINHADGDLYTIDPEYTVDNAEQYDYNDDGKFNLRDVYDFLDDVNYERAAVLAEKSAFDFIKDGTLDTADVQYLYEQLNSLADTAVVKATRVGSTGYEPKSYQSMTVDHDTDTLYWAAYQGYDGTCYFYEVDKTTGQCINVSPKGVQHNAEMTALFKPYTAYTKDIIPNTAKLTGIRLNYTSATMAAGTTGTLEATPVPYYAVLGEVEWSSDDDSVATVDKNGVVTAVAAGEATVTASCNGHTASCTIKVVKVDADLMVHDGYSLQWLSFKANAPQNAKDVDGMTPYETSYNYFISAAYAHGYVYAFDYYGGFYKLDADTMQGTRLGANNSVNGTSGLMLAMAYNYADGYLYGIAQQSEGMWDSSFKLVRINPSNGKSVEVGEFDTETYGIPYNMAVDQNGTFYSIVDAMDYDTWETATQILTYTVEDDYIDFVPGAFLTNFVPSDYATVSSLVWSEENNCLLWADYYGLLQRIDVTTGDNLVLGYIGNTANNESIYNTCLFEIVKDGPSAPEGVKVESIDVQENIQLLVGGSVTASVAVAPWNATADLTFKIDDEKIATVDKDGLITGLSVGTTTLTVTENSLDESVTAKVTVVPSTGSLYGMVVSDSNYGANYWATFEDTDPSNVSGKVDFSDSNFAPYAGAYYDGCVYAYSHAQTDENEYKYYLLKIDPVDYKYTVIGEDTKVHESIMDMAFDYETGTMYGVAYNAFSGSSLVQIDLDTAEVITVGYTEDQDIRAITFDDEYQLYGISVDGDLYEINKKTADVYKVGATGSSSLNGYQSMTYDYETGNTYWAQYSNDGTNGLMLVDLENGTAYNLGTINGTGASVACLYTVSKDDDPVVPETVNVSGVYLPEKSTVVVGETVTLNATVLPVSVTEVEGEITWQSKDEGVATVDENGVVTGVSAGTATITAHVGTSYSASCTVTVTEEARRFYAYDEDDRQWISFSADSTTEPTVVRKDEEGEEKIMASLYHDGKLYSFTADGQFWSVDPDTFERTLISEGFKGVKAEVTTVDWWGEETGYYDLYPLSMTYDEANDQAYVQMMSYLYDEYYDFYDFYSLILVPIDLEKGEVESTTETVSMMDWDTWEPYEEEVKVISGDYYQTDEGFTNAILVDDGIAVFVDTSTSGMVTYWNLATGEVMQVALVYNYWGNGEHGRSLYVDPLTGTTYVIRDMKDWGGITTLNTMTMSDGDVAEIGTIGYGYNVVNSLFIK